MRRCVMYAATREQRGGAEPNGARSEASGDGWTAGLARADWRLLYGIAGGAALLLVASTLLHAAVFFVTGLPATVLDWFTLFGTNALLGLLAFELLPVVYVIVSVPVVLALCAALGRANPSLMAIYFALSFVGIIAFIVARPAFEMLSLSNSYAAAASDAERGLLLAAGESMLAIFHGTAFWVSYVLGSIGGLLVATAMLRTKLFSRKTAYLRIASSILDFGLFVPTIGLFISLFSVLCLLLFNGLIAHRLLRLAGESTRQ
jgi:hypothetical protein